jgi:hypothetical protein
VVKDCSSYDGFFEQSFCRGNDVYRYYRDYFCGARDCEFETSDRLIEKCAVACSNGACTSQMPNHPVEVTVTSPLVKNQIPQQTEQPGMNIYGGNVYNGILFGSRNLEIETEVKSGTLYFEVKSTNRIGSLRVFSDGKEIFAGRPDAGAYSAGFEAGEKLIFSADSSGWIFFMPNSYYIAKAYVAYE